MLNRFARAFLTRLLTPVARLLLGLRISPDVVTIVGTIGVCVGGLSFYPRGELFWGTIIIAFFALSDSLDGIMARSSGRASVWGAFLDSTLDRVGDASVFGGLVLYFAADSGGDNLAIAAAALTSLVLGSVVSYARARAEGLGMRADVGIAERADRLVIVLLGAGLVGLGAPEMLLLIVLLLLAAASLVTVVQRVLAVRSQVLASVEDSGGRDG
jgi:CDP-diacylglycerol---glycerol-3-phosphate 3-phosphatidyltransferase